MNRMVAREVLSQEYVRVKASNCARELPLRQGPECVLVIFSDDSQPDGSAGFLGVLPWGVAAGNPSRVFGELLDEIEQPEPIPGQMDLREVVRRLNLKSGPALPVIDHSGFMGVVTVGSLVTSLLQREGELIGQTMQTRRHAVDDRRKRMEWVKRLEQLNRAFMKLISVLARPFGLEIFQRGLEAVAAVVSANYGAIVSVDDQGQIKESIFTGLVPGENRDSKRFLDQRKPLIERVIKEGQSLRVEEAKAYYREIGFPVRVHTWRTFLGVPITRDERSYGCVYLCDKSEETFTEDDEILVTSFAQALALVLAQARERAERERAERNLRRSEKKYRDLVNQIGVIVWEADAVTGRTDFVSHQAEALLGYPVSAWVSQEHFWLKHVYEDDRETAEKQHREAMQQGTGYESEMRIVRNDGSPAWFHVIVRPVEAEEERPARVSAVMVDISETKRNAMEQALLGRLGLELSGADTFEKLGDVVWRVTEEYWNWDSLFMLLRRATHVRMKSILLVDTFEGEKRALSRKAEHEYSTRPLETKLSQGVPILRNRTGEETEFDLAPMGNLDRRSASLMSAGIRVEGDVLGLISVQSYTAGKFQERDVQLLQRIADLLGPALVRCQAEQRLRAFSSLGYRLSAASDPREAAQIIVDIADELVGWDACSVYLHDPQTDQQYSVLSMDVIGGERKAFQVEPGSFASGLSPLARRVFEEGPRLVLRDKAEFDPAQIAPFGDESRPSASSIFVPLRLGSERIGIVSIQSYTYQAYDEKDMQLVQDLADHCARAVERIRRESALKSKPAGRTKTKTTAKGS